MTNARRSTFSCILSRDQRQGIGSFCNLGNQHRAEPGSLCILRGDLGEGTAFGCSLGNGCVWGGVVSVSLQPQHNTWGGDSISAAWALSRGWGFDGTPLFKRQAEESWGLDLMLEWGEGGGLAIAQHLWVTCWKGGGGFQTIWGQLASLPKKRATVNWNWRCLSGTQLGSPSSACPESTLYIDHDLGGQLWERQLGTWERYPFFFYSFLTPHVCLLLAFVIDSGQIQLRYNVLQRCAVGKNVVYIGWGIDWKISYILEEKV